MDVLGKTRQCPQGPDVRLTSMSKDFVFFDAGRPQPILAAAMREGGVDIGRPHPPYTNWARITIGLPSENLRAQNALRAGLKEI
jgi:histidinol-phosphate aminotransferase